MYRLFDLKFVFVNFKSRCCFKTEFNEKGHKLILGIEKHKYLQNSTLSYATPPHHNIDLWQSLQNRPAKRHLSQGNHNVVSSTEVIEQKLQRIVIECVKIPAIKQATKTVLKLQVVCNLGNDSLKILGRYIVNFTI